MKTASDKFVIKRSSAGLGMFAAAPIKKGEFIIEYKGEVITQKQANERGGQYLFETSSNRTVDGSSRKNTARYINHSCKPNAETDIRKGRIYVSSIAPIEPGEEITYDYGEEFFNEYIKPKGCKCLSCKAKKNK